MDQHDIKDLIALLESANTRFASHEQKIKELGEVFSTLLSVIKKMSLRAEITEKYLIDLCNTHAQTAESFVKELKNLKSTS